MSNSRSSRFLIFCSIHFICWFKKHETLADGWSFLLFCFSLSFIYKVYLLTSQHQNKLHVLWQWWHGSSSSSWDVALLLFKPRTQKKTERERGGHWWLCRTWTPMWSRGRVPKGTLLSALLLIRAKWALVNNRALIKGIGCHGTQARFYKQLNNQAFTVSQRAQWSSGITVIQKSQY